jgi:hypothetical protein
MSQDPKSTPKTPSSPKDACPSWADQLIKEMLVVEVRLGNIQPLDGTGEDWQTADLDKLQQRLDPEDGENVDEATAESLFRRIVIGLKQEGHDAARIATFINARMAGKSRLPYCDANDVEDALAIPLH